MEVVTGVIRSKYVYFCNYAILIFGGVRQRLTLAMIDPTVPCIEDVMTVDFNCAMRNNYNYNFSKVMSFFFTLFAVVLRNRSSAW